MSIRGFFRRLYRRPTEGSPPAPRVQIRLTEIAGQDEYAVYSAVLDTKYSVDKPERFVIAVETTSLRKGAFTGVCHGRARGKAKKPEVEALTTTDFENKNQDTYRLTDRFASSIPCTLATEDDLRQLFFHERQDEADKGGWRRFRTGYRGACGILAFSRVGFDPAKTEALVYVEHQKDFRDGFGASFVLSRKEGNWEVRSEVLQWLS
jgi:hypothetical protein